MQNKKMLEDIQNVISDDIMARQVIEDFKSTFEQLGVSENSTATLIFNILGSIRDADYIEKTEREIRKMFINQKVCLTQKGKLMVEEIACQFKDPNVQTKKDSENNPLLVKHNFSPTYKKIDL